MEEEPRRVESKYFQLTRESTQLWPGTLFHNASPGLEQAGMHLIYRVQIPEVLLPDPEHTEQFLRLRTVSHQFRLTKWFHREWIVVEKGKDDEGPWEKGYYHYFAAYIPIPWPREEFDRWVEELRGYMDGQGIY